MEIITPFVDDINDQISIYVEHLNSGKLRLSDDGYTLSNLTFMGLDLTTTRKGLVDKVLNQFNIKIIEEETLSIEGPEDDFPTMKFNLLSAILRINDLTFTKRDTVENLFFDEVITYFEGNDFGGMPTHFNGRSGVSYHFAYALPNHKGSPLVLLYIQNYPKSYLLRTGYAGCLRI